MANWQYLNLEFSWLTLAERQIALNTQGALGWELVTAIDFKAIGSTSFTCRATFKKTL
jgi:hypothetical protein